MTNNVPHQSNCLNSVFLLPRGGSMGMVQEESRAIIKKKMQMTIKDDRHPYILVDSPDDILPKIKPTGFPDPRAPVALLRRFPSGYIAKRAPIAGGETAAVPRPRKPHSTFMDNGFGVQKVMKEMRLRKAMP